MRILLLISLIALSFSFKLRLQSSSVSKLFSSKANAIVVVTVATGESLKNVPTGGSVVVRCDGLTKSYTGQPQLQDVALCICKGQRIGLVGGNGAGKSTFLKMLAKVMSPDSGTIEISSSANTVFVEQEPDWGDIVVYEGLFEGNDVGFTLGWVLGNIVGCIVG
jgi:ABC-type bacteriocin/lantibiotic exporter with double-glycine peptidase domain